MVKYSFVIPTYNRIFEVSRAIDSCIAFKNISGLQIEIIVVDDNSSDGTFANLSLKYSSQLSSDWFKIIKNTQNYGVVKSRIIGAKLASGLWLIPLDSDNEILFDAFHKIDSFLNLNLSAPCCMFLCVDENNNSIGTLNLNYKFFTLNDLLNKSFPEMCGIYNRIKFIEIFDNEFLFKIRRFEHIGNLRLLKIWGNFPVSHIVVRKYYTNSLGRLSGKSGVLKDAKFLFLGNFVLFFEFFKELSFKSKILVLLKIGYYLLITIKNLFFKI